MLFLYKIQKRRGGIASNFASSTQVVGVKRQAEIIEKITWGLAAALIILSLSSSAFSGTGGPVTADPTNSVVKDAPAQKNGNNGVVKPNTAPNTGTNAPTKSLNFLSNVFHSDIFSNQK